VEAEGPPSGGLGGGGHAPGGGGCGGGIGGSGPGGRVALVEEVAQAAVARVTTSLST
jgi:hypothetical protein